MAFLLDLPSVEGTNAQRRVKNVVDQGHGATISYTQKVESVDLTQLKEDDIKPILFNRSLDMFSIADREYIATELEDFN